tara:strand:+ start:4198 stop:5022 length:825 start_codon:yes stop_codon:yes gene_type:complete
MTRQNLKFLEYIDLLEELLLDSSRIPFTSNRLVDEQEAIEILDKIRELLPKEAIKASELIKEASVIHEETARNAKDIIDNAKRQRDKIVDRYSVKEEAERQISDIKMQAYNQSEKIIQKANLIASDKEKSMRIKLVNMEQEYLQKTQILEKQLLERKNEYDNKSIAMNINLKKQHDRKVNEILKDLEEFKNESILARQTAIDESNKIKNEALSIHQATKLECDKLIIQTKKDVNLMKEGANSYADKTLTDLESTLNKLNKIIIEGKRQLDPNKI